MIQSSPSFAGQDTGLHGLAALRQRAHLIMLCTAMGLAAGVLTYATQPPHFVAEAVVALDVRRLHSLPIDQVVAPLPQESPVLRTELDLIESRDMAQRVMRVLSGDGRDADDPPPLDLRRIIPHIGGLQAIRMALAAGIRSTFEHTPERPSEDDTRIERALRGNLTVLNDGRSYTIYIAFGASEPDVAAQVANAYARAYIAYQDDLQIEATQRVRTWLAARLATLGTSLQQAEQAVEQFRTVSGLLDVGGVTIAAQRVSAIHGELVAARAAFATAEARERTAAQLTAGPDGAEGFSDVLASPIIQQLRGRQSDLERTLQVLNNTGASRSASVPGLVSELQTVEQQIDREMAKIVVSLRHEILAAGRRVASLEAQLREAETEHGSSDAARVRLDALVREANADRAVFESLLARAKEIGDRQALTDPGVRLISAASAPGQPSSPRLLPALMFGLLAGMTGGCALALALGRFDHRIRSRRDLAIATGLPVLAAIPKAGWRYRSRAAETIIYAPGSAYAEAVTLLHGWIRHSPSMRRASVLVLTSKSSREKRSELALALARATNWAGRSVVLLSLEARENLRWSVRTTNVDEGTLEEVEALQADLPAGSSCVQDVETSAWLLAVPAAASSLLGSELDWLGPLLSALRSRFDAVFIDMPAKTCLSEAATIAAETDVVVLVARSAVTMRPEATELVGRLLHYGLPLRAALLTDAPRQHEQPVETATLPRLPTISERASGWSAVSRQGNASSLIRERAV
jgi:uncharacterized protein involved in exopolysaccharide biosynthesis/Mrp family chromosome partitioning ATPase